MASRVVARKRPGRRKPGPSGVQLGEASARGLILQGGTIVFAERGVRAASVDDLLEASGVSRRTFYRLYQSKEDVVDALYRIGTDALLSACAGAISRESDPMRQVMGCIDAHLNNARVFGRLVFVLGGEAQRYESSLHTRRMEVQEAIVELLREGLPGAQAVDPLLLRAVVLALEGITRMVLAEGDEGRHVSDAGIERARRVMARLASACLAGEGEGVAPLPLMEST